MKTAADAQERRNAVWITCCAEETEALGTCLGWCLDKGDVVGLTGELGGGKTTLTRGIARGLDVPDSCPVQSPTFTLVNEYPGRCTVYHLDLYRLEPGREWGNLGFEEFLDPEGVAVIEWAEKIRDELPEDALFVILEYENDIHRIRVEAPGPRARRILECLVHETKRTGIRARRA